MKEYNNQVEKTEVVKYKEKFYSDKLVNYLWLLISGGLIILFLLFIITYLFATEPRNKYFLSSSEGQIFKSENLDQPIFTEAEVRDWAAQAMINTLDFNFLNYEVKLHASKDFFTPDGYNMLYREVMSKDVPTIVYNRLSAKLSLCDVAVVNKSISKVYAIDGANRYVWYVTLPAYIHYEDNLNRYITVANVELQVQRVSDLNYLSGLAIRAIRIPTRTTVSTDTSNLPICTNG